MSCCSFSAFANISPDGTTVGFPLLVGTSVAGSVARAFLDFNFLRACAGRLAAACPWIAQPEELRGMRIEG